MAVKKRRHRISDYKFSEYSHSKEGIAGIVLGLLSLIIFLVCLKLSYSSEGNASIVIGGAAINALIFAVVGLVLSFKGYKDEDAYKSFPKLGIFISGLAAFFWLGIIVLGVL